jgi:hypothetical protein
MTDVVWVTTPQVEAARLLAERLAGRGEPVPNEVLRIARALEVGQVPADDSPGGATVAGEDEESLEHRVDDRVQALLLDAYERLTADLAGDTERKSGSQLRRAVSAILAALRRQHPELTDQQVSALALRTELLLRQSLGPEQTRVGVRPEP